MREACGVLRAACSVRRAACGIQCRGQGDEPVCTLFERVTPGSLAGAWGMWYVICAGTRADQDNRGERSEVCLLDKKKACRREEGVRSTWGT